jgi:hypothetical protein
MTSTYYGSSDITSEIMLYDHEIKRITDGPLAWANFRVGSARSIDDFHKGLREQFEKIGLLADVGVYDMGVCECGPLAAHDAEQCPRLVPVEGSYIFKVVILGRVSPESGFDYDRMKHEVRANILDLPGGGGTIKFDEREFLKRHGGGRHGRHTYRG